MGIPAREGVDFSDHVHDRTTAFEDSRKGNRRVPAVDDADVAIGGQFVLPQAQEDWRSANRSATTWIGREDFAQGECGDGGISR